MGRIHPTSNLVAFDNNGGSRGVAWFGDRRLYQRGADPKWETVAVDANQQAETLRPFGALGVRAGALTWHTRINIGGVPILASPTRAMDLQVGYEGAVAASADVSVTLDLEKQIAHVWAATGKVRSIPLPGGVAAGGDPWVDQFGEWLAVSCFVPQVRLTLVRLDTGEIVTPVCMTPANHYTPACVTVGGIVWVVYHTDEYGLCIHPATDPTKRKILAPPPAQGSGIYGVDVCLINGNVEVIWFAGQSEIRPELRAVSITTAALLSLPSVPVPVILPPPVDPPNGPLGPPEPPGTVVNVAADFFALDGRAWPRGNKAKGDTHGMDYQAVTHFGEACLWECKFDTDGKGRLGELLSIDMGPDGQPDPQGYIHWRADCSDAGDPGALNPDGTVKRPPREAFVDVPSDTRWLRNVMQVGRAYGLDVGDHILRKVRRRDGTLIREVGFNREMWIEALWRRYWMNPWGEVELLVYAYNNTGFRAGRGNGDPATWVERYWQARKRMPDGSWLVIAWGDWGSDPSSVVFAGGGTSFPAVPNPRSSFWHLGGQRFAPDLPPFQLPISVPPIEVPTMKLPSDVLATIQLFASAKPIPKGDGSDDWIDAALRKGWTRQMQEQVCFTHGPKWGGKKQSNAHPDSKEAIALNDNGLHVWDMLVGAATGNPTLNGNPSYYFVPEQVFVPVTPVNHLDIAPPTGRPSITAPFWGVTSFDLGCRLEEGDRRWVDQVLKPTGLIPRIVVASRFRTPRTLADGLRQLALTLKTLAAEGLKGNFVLLCDTKEYGISRQEALDQVRAANALLVQYPAAVALVAAGNEIFHGVEQPYMSDPTFWAEVSALVDPRFPFAPGANDGGGAVLLTGGSVIVHHPDRGLSPDENGQIMAAATAAAKRPVINDEDLGVAEPDRVPGRQRTADPNFGRLQVAARKKYGLGGVTAHLDAGMTCNVDELGDVQRAYLAILAAEVNRTPAPQGDPILDVDLRKGPDQMSDAGYLLYVNRRAEVEAAVAAWYAKAHGRVPADSDVVLGAYIRGVAERDRWHTLRAALTNIWPGGAPA